jgi:predicted Zn-dependent peptidase
LLEVLAGRASPLYNSLMEKGLINTTFDADYFDGPGYGVWVFAGESSDPDAVAQAVRTEISRLRQDGIPQTDFEAAKNALYGRQVAALNDVDSIGDSMVSDFFSGRSPYSAVGAAAALTPQAVKQLLDTCFDEKQMSLSVVLPE